MSLDQPRPPREGAEEYISDLQQEIAELKEKLASAEEDSAFLERLHAAGVDNWSGYEFAVSQEAFDREFG